MKIHTQVVCDLNVHKMNLINWIIENIFLLDKKIFSIKVGSYYSNSLGINQITKKHLDFVNSISFLNKEEIIGLIESMINSTHVVLLDKTSLLASRATIQDITKNCLIIVTSTNNLELPGINIEYNHLRLERPDLQTFFQILSNNYHHKQTKLDFLNFFARHANNYGFLNMGKRELCFSGKKIGISFTISNQQFFIFMNNTYNSSIEIFESFKITSIRHNNKIHFISAIVGLCSTIDVSKKQKIINQKLFICANKNITVLISNIFGGDWLDYFRGCNESLSHANKYIYNHWRQLLLNDISLSNIENFSNLEKFHKKRNHYNNFYTEEDAKENICKNIQSSYRLSIF